MAKSLQDTVAAWTNSAGTAQTNYVKGIQSSSAPIVQAAIAAQGAMVSAFNESVSSGRWANALNAVGDAGIRAAAVAKAGNFATGIQQGATKYQAAMATWLPIIDQAAAKARAMPATVGGPNNNRSASLATDLWNAKRGR